MLIATRPMIPAEQEPAELRRHMVVGYVREPRADDIRERATLKEPTGPGIRQQFSTSQKMFNFGIRQKPASDAQDSGVRAVAFPAG